jgi:hypothetical protein
MNKTQELEGQMTEKTDEELLDMLAQRDDWTSAALDSAKAELQKRGVAPKEIAQQVAVNSTSSLTPVEQSGEYVDLQVVAKYRGARRSLRLRGIGSIIWGIIAIAIGASSIEANPVNGILVLIGLFLSIEGIWLSSRPVAAGMIIDGFMLLVLGVWNIYVTCMSPESGGVFGILGVAQIIWGFQSFWKYGTAAAILKIPPSELAMQRFDQIVIGMKSATMTNDPSLIEFENNSVNKSFNRHQNWKARLDLDKAFFLGDGENSGLILAPKQKVLIYGNVLKGTMIKANLSTGDRTFSVRISPDAFQRYAEWKNANSDVPHEDAEWHSSIPILSRHDNSGDIQWYHVMVAIIIPYIGLPWGIVNLVRKRRRSGLLMTTVSGGLLLFILVAIYFASS